MIVHAITSGGSPSVDCRVSAVVSSVSSASTWAEKSLHPVGRTDEVWNHRLHRPPRPLLYGNKFIQELLNHYLLFIFELEVWQKCHVNQYECLLVSDLIFFSSTTSRPTRPRSSSTARQCMNMKDITRLTASWSSFRCCWTLPRATTTAAFSR